MWTGFQLPYCDAFASVAALPGELLCELTDILLLEITQLWVQRSRTGGAGVGAKLASWCRILALGYTAISKTV